MNDRELLEAAARAEGRSLGAWWEASSASYNKRYAGYGCPGPNVTWNPLTDDGDALRLAVQCKLEVSTIDDDGERASVGYSTELDPRIRYVFEDHRGNIFAATRRAIVRAAAAIGGAK